MVVVVWCVVVEKIIRYLVPVTGSTVQATGTIIINYKIIKTAASISSSFLLSGIIINILLINKTTAEEERREEEFI